MTDLSKVSDHDLEEEIKRRAGIPEQLFDVDLTSLRTITKEYMNSLYSDNRPPKDAEHYIFETVMKTLYGENIFKWISDETRG